MIIVNGVPAVNNYHKMLNLGYCSSPRFASENVNTLLPTKKCSMERCSENFTTFTGKTRDGVFIVKLQV